MSAPRNPEQGAHIEPSCDRPGHAPTGIRRPTQPLVIEQENLAERVSCALSAVLGRDTARVTPARAASHADGLGAGHGDDSDAIDAPGEDYPAESLTPSGYLRPPGSTRAAR